MRVMIAGTGSGCGKTTASLVLMAALQRRGLTVAPCKVGPDYIDPGYHRAVCGCPSQNLDTFLTEPEDLPWLLDNKADVTVIEGVMGYYDGLDSVSLRCSSWEAARLTKTPVILTVDASGGAASVAAQVQGFRLLKEDSMIAGVLVNRASSRRHYELVRDALLYYTGLPCIGWLPKDMQLTFPSRHLGLVPAEEQRNLRERIFAAAERSEDTLELDTLLRIASAAPALPVREKHFPVRRHYRLGVAMDEAFSFYYDADLRILRESGFELCFFSPLSDEALPERLDGLYLGGGFPEVFAEALSANKQMRRAVRAALEGGLPCYAECGGMMYLCRSIDGHEMTGFFPADCRMTPRLQRFGYVTIQDSTGLTFPAHEFHHSVTDFPEDTCFSYTVTKASAPERQWRCGAQRKNTLGAYAHLHFLSHPELIARLWPEKEGSA